MKQCRMLRGINSLEHNAARHRRDVDRLLNLTEEQPTQGMNLVNHHVRATSLLSTDQELLEDS